jgi:hypothetical protein
MVKHTKAPSIKKTQPVVKNAPTKKDCIAGADNNYTINKMSCGTNPNPANANCYRKAYGTYAKAVEHCNKFGR